VTSEVVLNLSNQALFPLPNTDLSQEVSEFEPEHIVHEIKPREGVVLEESNQVLVRFQLQKFESIENAKEFEHVRVRVLDRLRQSLNNNRKESFHVAQRADSIKRDQEI